MAEKLVRRYSSAGGVVIDAAGRVLLIERILDGVHEVRLPKGHVDPGETPEAAALREVCEETGYCDLAIVADLGCHTNQFDRLTEQVIREETYFLMSLASERRQTPQFANEREALYSNRWVSSFVEAEQALTFEAERDVVRRAGSAWQSIDRQEVAP